MPINYASGGAMPGPSGETASADGQDPSAGMDMSVACSQAADSALAHAASEGAKVAMSVQSSATE
jgi:hypothetical protein